MPNASISAGATRLCWFANRRRVKRRVDRAQMCSPEEMPHDVVTMNAGLNSAILAMAKCVCARWCIGKNDRQQYSAFRYGSGRCCMLGLRVGDSIHWELPGGVATTLKCWNSNTSQKLLATTCFNPSAQAITRFAQRMHSHPLSVKYQPDLSFCS